MHIADSYESKMQALITVRGAGALAEAIELVAKLKRLTITNQSPPLLARIVRAVYRPYSYPSRQSLHIITCGPRLPNLL